VLEIVRRLNDIPWTTVRKFFSRQLNVFFTKQTDAGKQVQARFSKHHAGLSLVFEAGGE